MKGHVHSFDKDGVTDTFDGKKAKNIELLKKKLGELGDSVSYKLYKKIKHDSKLDESIDSEKEWPICFREKTWGQSVGEGVAELLGLTDIEQFSGVTGSVYMSSMGEHYEKILNLNVKEKTRKMILDGIFRGDEILISRVVESNIQNFFPIVDGGLKMTSKKPLVELRLTPIESLPKIADEESRKISHKLSRGTPVEKIAPFERGISDIPTITRLRHLSLPLATITATLYLLKTWPENFSFQFGPDIPTARDLIIKNGKVINNCMFIGLFEYDIGLDSTVYSVKPNGLESFAYELEKETKNPKSRELKPDDFHDIYEKIEGLLRDEISKEHVSKNVDAKFILGNVSYWKNYAGNIIENKIPQDKDVMKEISEKQSSIEKHFANLRRSYLGSTSK